MRSTQKPLSGKRKYHFGVTLLLFACAICITFNMARREILLRSIGHELLLQSGDITSKILPVEKIAKNETRQGLRKNLLLNRITWLSRYPERKALVETLRLVAF